MEAAVAAVAAATAVLAAVSCLLPFDGQVACLPVFVLVLCCFVICFCLRPSQKKWIAHIQVCIIF